MTTQKNILKLLKAMAGVLIFIQSAGLHAQTGKEYVQRMYDAYASKWYPRLSFIQTTQVFRNDSLIKTATWFEAITFPFRFRIDTDTSTGSGVIFSRDSTYHFKNNKLLRTTAGGNPFTFSLGGMYFMPFDSVLAEFARTGYDLSRGYETTWLGRRTLVIGNSLQDSTGNSLWIDAKLLYVVRTIEWDHDRRIDARMSDQQQIAGGWSETTVRIYANDKLIQLEAYNGLSASRPLNDCMYKVDDFGACRWYKQEEKK